MLNALKTRLAEQADEHVGLLAEFSDPGALLHAVEDLRERGYAQLDTFSPFPIHGMDRAMGLPVSKLGFMVFVGGATGLFLAVLMQWWMGAVDYPINISNKPLFAFEPSIPIMFELTVLFSALTAVGGMLALNRLPKPYDPLFHSERFLRATDDAFFLHVAAADPSFDAGETAATLYEIGALAVESIDHDGAADVGPDGTVLLHTPAEPVAA
jgi:hypothetical protein